MTHEFVLPEQMEDLSSVSRCSNTRANEHTSDRPAMAQMGFFKHMNTRQTLIECNSIISMVKKKKSLCIVDSICKTNLTVSLFKQQRIILATVLSFSRSVRQLVTHCYRGSLSKARTYLIFVVMLSSPGI